MAAHIDLPTPDFPVFDEDITACVMRQHNEVAAYTSQVLDAKQRAYHGYIENAFTDPEAYRSTTVPGLVRLAHEWAEAEWREYLR